MRKRIFGHMRTTKAQIRLRFRAACQGLHCPLTESLDIVECMIGKQRPEWYMRRMILIWAFSKALFRLKWSNFSPWLEVCVKHEYFWFLNSRVNRVYGLFSVYFRCKNNGIQSIISFNFLFCFVTFDIVFIDTFGFSNDSYSPFNIFRKVVFCLEYWTKEVNFSIV